VPYRQVETPLAAFGGLTAQATEHLGQAESGAGNEIFARGLAMQQLNQEAQANEAVANFQNKMLQSYSDFTDKRGNDAVQGLQPFMESTAQTRQAMAAGLDSDYARKLFDNESRSSMFRINFSAATHAKEQNRQYVNGAIQSKIASDGYSALQNPADDAGFQASIDRLPQDYATLAQTNGWSPEERDQKMALDRSNLYAQRIQGMAKTHPYLAQQEYNKAVQGGNLVGQDVARVGNFVTSQGREVGSRNIATQSISGADLTPGQGIVSQTSAREAVGQYESKGNYTAIGPDITHRVNGTDVTEHALGKYQVMQSNLQPWLKEAGMAPMSEAEFLKSPTAQDALFDFKFSQYQQEGKSFNAAVNRWFSGSYNPDPNTSDGYHTANQYLVATNATLAHNMPLADLQAKARAIASQQYPDDPIVGDYAVSHVDAMYNQQRMAQRNDEFNNQQTIASALMPGQDGKLVTSLEELKAKDPSGKVEAAWNSLPATKQLQYREIFAKNAKGGYAQTPENQAEFYRLSGIALNPASTPEQLQELLSTDVNTLYMPAQQAQMLLKTQQQVFKSQQGNPAVTHALQVLSPVLNDPAIDINKKDNPDDYNKFIGALHDAMQVRMEYTKKPLNDDEIKDIGSRLLQQKQYPGKWFGTNSDHMFKTPVPDDQRQKIIDSFADYGQVPTEIQINNAWVAKQFNELYSKGQK
jgi:hypothetical protein